MSPSAKTKQPPKELSVRLTPAQVRCCISGLAYLSAGEEGEDGGWQDATEHQVAQRAFARLHQALAQAGLSVDDDEEDN
jgi:hypothetical protein